MKIIYKIMLVNMLVLMTISLIGCGDVTKYDEVEKNVQNATQNIENVQEVAYNGEFSSYAGEKQKVANARSLIKKVIAFSKYEVVEISFNNSEYTSNVTELEKMLDELNPNNVYTITVDGRNANNDLLRMSILAIPKE